MAVALLAAMPPTTPTAPPAAATASLSFRRPAIAESPPVTRARVPPPVPTAIRARSTSLTGRPKVAPGSALTSASPHVEEATAAARRGALASPTAIVSLLAATARYRPKKPVIPHRPARPAARATVIPARSTSWWDRRPPAPRPARMFPSCAARARSETAAAPPRAVRSPIQTAKLGAPRAGGPPRPGRAAGLAIDTRGPAS